MGALRPLEAVTEKILIVRAQRVLIDADLAALYGVTTKRLNEQVKRNKGRFPADFMFQLTAKEKKEVVANCDHLENLKFSRNRPWNCDLMNSKTKSGKDLALMTAQSPR